MNEALAQALAALELTLRLSLPILAAAFAVALVASLLAALTRLGEPALAALPRALVTLLLLGSTGAFMGRELLAYTSGLLRALPELAR